MRLFIYAGQSVDQWCVVLNLRSLGACELFQRFLGNFVSFKGTDFEVRFPKHLDRKHFLLSFHVVIFLAAPSLINCCQLHSFAGQMRGMEQGWQSNQSIPFQQEIQKYTALQCTEHRNTLHCSVRNTEIHCIALQEVLYNIWSALQKYIAMTNE